MLNAFVEDSDIECGERLFGELQHAEEDGEQKLRNEAIYLYLRYSAGGTSAMDKLFKLLERVGSTPQVLPVVHNCMGMAYEKSDEFAKASESYECAAQASQTDTDRASYKVSVARSTFLLGDPTKARNEIEKELSVSEVPDVRAQLYQGLADLYDRMGNIELKAIALEKAVEYSPNDKHLRFDAAYAYSEAKLECLALLHYLKATEFDPNHSAALNNAGVVYGQMGMPIRQVESYKKASKDHSLASANIAHQYIRAGFAEEAIDILNEANQKEKVHSNVNGAFSALAAARKSEEDKEKQSLDEARAQRQHLSIFGEAYSDSSARISLPDGQWQLTDGTEVSISENGNILEFRWEKQENKYLIKAMRENRGLKTTTYKRADSYSSDLADNGYAYITKDSRRIVLVAPHGTVDED
jgi:tetratricopeptide (TPR) repeat protein